MGGADAGPCLVNDGFLQPRDRVQVRQQCLLRGDGAVRLGQRGAEVAVVDPEQQVAFWTRWLSCTASSTM